MIDPCGFHLGAFKQEQVMVHNAGMAGISGGDEDASVCWAIVVRIVKKAKKLG